MTRIGIIIGSTGPNLVDPNGGHEAVGFVSYGMAGGSRAVERPRTPTTAAVA